MQSLNVTPTVGNMIIGSSDKISQLLNSAVGSVINTPSVYELDVPLAEVVGLHKSTLIETNNCD